MRTAISKARLVGCPFSQHGPAQICLQKFRFSDASYIADSEDGPVDELDGPLIEIHK